MFTVDATKRTPLDESNAMAGLNGAVAGSGIGSGIAPHCDPSNIIIPSAGYGIGLGSIGQETARYKHGSGSGPGRPATHVCKPSSGCSS